MENLVKRSGMFNNTYKGKRVLVTGHTGFKGAWLSLWLLKLGAKVYGISSDIPTHPSLFETLGLSGKLDDRKADINQSEEIYRQMESIKPDFIFHLAAQAIVSTSYQEPVDTIKTNVLGTASILDAVRRLDAPCTLILVSSDKCYENKEWLWGYRENDRLGGKDVYSASKGAMEIIIHSYYHSFFKQASSPVKLASVRAGNVIGGGDWALNRIVPDCFRAWSKQQPVEVRNPSSTRPWQHVLDPLSGYLRLGQLLSENAAHHGESYNFGPEPSQNYSVKEMLEELSATWEFKPGTEKLRTPQVKASFHEAGLLKLNCEKAKLLLSWEPNLNFHEAIRFTADWYKQYYHDERSVADFTGEQLEKYMTIAREKKRSWAI